MGRRCCCVVNFTKLLPLTTAFPKAATSLPRHIFVVFCGVPKRHPSPPEHHKYSLWRESVFYFPFVDILLDGHAFQELEYQATPGFHFIPVDRQAEHQSGTRSRVHSLRGFMRVRWLLSLSKISRCGALGVLNGVPNGFSTRPLICKEESATLCKILVGATDLWRASS